MRTSKVFKAILIHAVLLGIGMAGVVRAGSEPAEVSGYKVFMANKLAMTLDTGKSVTVKLPKGEYFTLYVEDHWGLE